MDIDKVKELADRAWTIVSAEERSCGALYESDKQQFRRDQVFAELIVEECVSQCLTVSELGSKGFAISECAKRIRKHFGVK